MIDIHNHILYGIDDGCKTIDDSLKTLKEAQELGINSIILTPHYIKGSKYNCNNKNKKILLNELNKVVVDEGLTIKLYLGNEVYIENDMIDLIRKGEITTLNNSRYLLFELPMGSEINNLSEIIFQLRVEGVIPIIAHPERYSQFQMDPQIIKPLLEQGCLFQGNLSSLVGIYGKKAQKCLKILLKNNYIQFLASDVHHPNSKNFKFMDVALKKLCKLVGENISKELLEINPQKVLNDEIFDIKEPKNIKRKLFFF